MKFDFKRFFGKIRVNFNSSLEYLQTSGQTLVAAVVVSIILMAAICVLVFFAAVQGPEEVLIPDVTGKYLEEALLEMQIRELYPKINLRYSDAPGDKGKVLSQDPVAGSIAKAGRRIDLVVSSGVLVDQVGDYTGMKLTELENRLSVLFSGKQPLITLAEPMYIADPSDPGTILSQNPLPGTMLAEPVALDLVVSKGPTNEEVKIPELIDMSISELLAQLPRTRLVFDFNSREATAEEIKAIYQKKCDIFNSLGAAPRMPGALEILTKIKDSGIIPVIVTGSGQTSLLEKLNNNFPGIFNPQLMVTAFDVKYGKPNPEPYLIGLKKANVQPNEAIVVENAPLGVRAGVSAGVFTVAVNTGPLPDESLLNEGANLLFHSMNDFNNNWDTFYKTLSE